MKDDLLMEYMKFQHVASMQQANASEQDAKMINYRLELLKKRYEEYSEKGLGLVEVKKLEQEHLRKIKYFSETLGK